MSASDRIIWQWWTCSSQGHRRTSYLCIFCAVWYSTLHSLAFNSWQSMSQGFSTQRRMQFHATTSHFSVSTGTTCGHTTAIAGAACSEETQLGLRRLDSTVQALISQGVAESTRAVYQSGWRHYSIGFALSTHSLFCHSMNTLSANLLPSCQSL